MIIRYIQASEEFVATELRSFINNVARGVGFAVDRNIHLPYGMHLKSFNPSVSIFFH